MKEKYVPREKMSRKARKALDSRARQGWGAVNPVSRRSKNLTLTTRRHLAHRFDDDAGCFSV